MNMILKYVSKIAEITAICKPIKKASLLGEIPYLLVKTCI